MLAIKAMMCFTQGVNYYIQSIFSNLTLTCIIKEPFLLIPSFCRKLSDTLSCSILRILWEIFFFLNSSVAASGLMKGGDLMRQEVTGLEVSLYMW